ncbi:MAG: hypothetical protein ACYCW6_08115 [Candidatus Xenobia bacterium]
MTVLLWFFLASNPNLGDHHTWQYSARLNPVTDRQVNVYVHRSRTPNSNGYEVDLKAKKDEEKVYVERQMNGYRVVWLAPNPKKTDFVPFFPNWVGSTWTDGFKLASIMNDVYDVGAEVGINGRVVGLNLSEPKAPKSVNVYYGEKVGLRRLRYGKWDYSIVNVDYGASANGNYPPPNIRETPGHIPGPPNQDDDGVNAGSTQHQP